MCDSARELPNGLDLLGLTQGLFARAQGFAVFNVSGDVSARRIGPAAARSSHPGNPADRPVLVEILVYDPNLTAALRDLHGVIGLVMVLGNDELVDMVPHQFIGQTGAISEDSRALRDLSNSDGARIGSSNRFIRDLTRVNLVLSRVRKYHANRPHS